MTQSSRWNVYNDLEHTYLKYNATTILKLFFQTIMSGSLCNSFGSLPARVHERPRKWCAPQRLRTKRNFVLLWLFDQVKQSGELLSPFAALPSLPLEETPPLWFVSHSNKAHQTPPKIANPWKIWPLSKRDLVRRSSRSAWLPSFSSLPSSCSSTFQGWFLFLCW